MMSGKRIATFLIACLLVLPCFSTWVIAAEDDPFKVGDNYYPTLSAAAAAVEAGGVIEVVKDAEMEKTETISAKKAFTIKGVKGEDGSVPVIKGDVVGEQGKNDKTMYIIGASGDADNTGLEITFEDIVLTNINSGGILTIYNKAKVTLGEGAVIRYGTTVTGAVPAVCPYNATFILDKGEMYCVAFWDTSTYSGLVRIGENAQMIIKDGVMKKGKNWMIALVGNNSLLEVYTPGILNSEGIRFSPNYTNKTMAYIYDGERFEVTDPEKIEGTNVDYQAHPRFFLEHVENGVSNKHAYYEFTKAVENAKDGDIIHVMDFGDNTPLKVEPENALTITVEGHGYVYNKSTGSSFGTDYTAIMMIGEKANVTVKNFTLGTKPGDKNPSAVIFVFGKLTLGEGAVVKTLTNNSTNNFNAGVRMMADLSELTVLAGARIETSGTAIVTENVSSVVTIDGGYVESALRGYAADGEDNAVELNVKAGTFKTIAGDELINAGIVGMIAVNVSGGVLEYCNQEVGVMVYKDKPDTSKINQTGGVIRYADPSGVAAVTTEVFAGGEVKLRLPEEASLFNSGISFGTKLDKEVFDAIEADSITMGTIVVAKSAFEASGQSSVIDYLGTSDGTARAMRIPNNSGWYNDDTVEEDGYYLFYGSIVNLYPALYAEDFIAVAYVTVTVEDVPTTVYSEALTGNVKDLAGALTIVDEQGRKIGTAEQREMIAEFLSDEA